MDLIERAARYIGKMPPAISGQGGHNLTFHAACILVQGFGLSPEQAFPILAEYNQRCSPPWNEKELRHKLTGADRAVSVKGRGWLAKGAEWTPSKDWRDYHAIPEPPKPQFEAEKLAKFSGEWAKRIDLVWLANRSSLDPATVSAAKFLELLYAPGEKVCVFTQEYSATIGAGVTLWPDTPPPEAGPEPRPCGVWYMAQPVDGRYHPTDEGDKMSCRNHRAVTAWRYLVIESDEADTRQWLGAIVQLPLRIAAMYSSGGRSVHALVRVDARTKGEWDAERDKLRTALTVLGADPKTLTAVRLTRLPGCLRHGKMVNFVDGDGQKKKRYDRFPRPKLQKLLYVNARPDLAPLIDVFARRDVVQDWCTLAGNGAADSDETGGEWIANGLGYYAGVSAECAAELQAWKEGAAR